MASNLDLQKINLVFQSRPDILNGIQQAADSPARVILFNEIASFVYEQLQNPPEPAAKRRRVDDGQSNRPVMVGGAWTTPGHVRPLPNGSNSAEESILLEIKEISVSVPQRKKFDLVFTANRLYARAPGTTEPVPGIAYAWKDIEYAFYLPVPEKSQVQHNYVLFPKGTCLPVKGSLSTTEPLVFTVPSTAPKQGTVAGPKATDAARVADDHKTLFDWALATHLAKAGNRTDIISADPTKFHSAIRQPQRPNEKAVHVKAFRGSKDGYLFFLQNGILWGFKKPLMFVPLDHISAVSYTSVLQRTFNMVVEVFPGEGEAADEMEFAMIDQEDYGGIDAYVRQNRLQDKSMAEQRKAKLELAENRQKKGTETAGGDSSAAGQLESGGMSELQKAHHEVEQQLQDEEDELEEDYDPGSEGDSEGSGESSEEEDDDGEDGADDETEDEEYGEDSNGNEADDGDELAE